MKRIEPEELELLLRLGRDNARKAKELGEYFDAEYPDIRAVTIAVRELIKGGLPVAASTDALTGGYFITDTREEADHYILFMRSHIIELCKRMRDYKRAARPLLQPGQLPLM